MYFLEILYDMYVFAAQYGLMKCLRTMAAGMVVFPLIVLIRACNRRKRADVNYHAMLLMLSIALTGTNRLFFQPVIVRLTIYLHVFARPIYGEIYFAVMTLLLLRFLWKNRRFKRRIRALPLWENEEERGSAVRAVAGNSLFGLQRRYLERVRVYVTEDCVSPFSGGLLRPFVVAPRRMLEEWPEDERRIVLYHELTHLKSGHILWLWLFQLLKIYWWINPVVYLCERLFREDMEMVCDEQCIRDADVSCGTYGRALISMIALMQGVSPEGTLCFSGRNDFHTMKKRIGSLAASDQGRCSRRRCRRHRALFAGVFAGVLAVLALTSYPRYTRLDDIVLYDENLQMLDYDSAQLRAAVRVSDGRVIIDPERFGELLGRKRVRGEYVYISFDTIMKVPGSGGCGNVGMVSLADYSDIFYLSEKCPENAIREFWLKYLV